MPPPARRQKTSYNARTKSVTTLKKLIRDIERLLSRENSNLTADGRLDKERALAAYNLELKNATRNKKEQEMAKKYHMVRFFGERRPSWPPTHG